jgi:hypothetical protein
MIFPNTNGDYGKKKEKGFFWLALPGNAVRRGV